MRINKLGLAVSLLLLSFHSFAEIRENITEDPRTKEALEESAKIKERLEALREGDVSSLEEAKATDIRLRAMKEAATSLGIQEGYAYQVGILKGLIEKEAESYDAAFDFSSLMRAGGKIANEQYVIPPVISEVKDTMSQKEDGRQMVLSGQVFTIISNVKLSSAPPDWRQYIFTDEATETTAPPKDLLPKNSDEREKWKGWIDEGFKSGLEIGDIEFRDRIARLRLDFTGMARYMRLVEEGKVREPTVAIQHIKLDGDDKTMKIRTSIYTITEDASMVIDGKRKTRSPKHQAQG